MGLDGAGFSPKDRFENEVLAPFLNRGYDLHHKVIAGPRLGGGQHRITGVLIHPKSRVRTLVDLMWQSKGGSAEQKLPFRALCLQHVLDQDPDARKGLIIMGGHGWGLADFFESSELLNLIRAPSVQVLRHESFVANCQLVIDSIEGQS